MEIDDYGPRAAIEGNQTLRGSLPTFIRVPLPRRVQSHVPDPPLIGFQLRTLRELIKYLGGNPSVLFNFVCDYLVRKFDVVYSAECFSPIWSVAPSMNLNIGRRRNAGHTHRDIIPADGWYLTGLLFYGSFSSGGLEFWHDSRDFRPEDLTFLSSVRIVDGRRSHGSDTMGRCSPRT